LVVDVVGKLDNPVAETFRSIGTVSQLLPEDSSVRRFSEALRTPFWARPDFQASVVEHGPIAALQIHDVATAEAAAKLVNVLSSVGPLAGSPVTRAAVPLAAQGASSGVGSFIGSTLADDDITPPYSPIQSGDGGTVKRQFGGTASGDRICEEVIARYRRGEISLEYMEEFFPECLSTFKERQLP
jgi:hypothetical protein